MKTYEEMAQSALVRGKALHKQRKKSRTTKNWERKEA